uniref:Uncharacterized protein n=1 Tax=Anguilla anguilla TaxID=7936 RepID=A0A0E9WN27_ANGAN
MSVLRGLLWPWLSVQLPSRNTTFTKPLSNSSLTSQVLQYQPVYPEALPDMMLST